MGLSNVQALTYHSLGFAMVRNSRSKQRIVVDQDKIDKALPNYLDKYYYRPLYPAVKRLVSLVKSNLCEPDTDMLESLSAYHNIELNGDADMIFNAVRDMLHFSQTRTDIIDFDDMIWIPLMLNMSANKYDLIIVDELQDTNPAQIELAIRSINPNGSIIGVGDRNQSIYGFRGADVNAIPNLINRLEAETLPLSITYRNPRKIVNLVNEQFHNIEFLARDNAPDGILETIPSNMFEEKVNLGNMVLCRVNAPLVGYCFSLIRKGIKAIIKGRDIGKNLSSLVKKMRADNVLDLISKLSDYFDLESEKLYRSNKTGQMILLQDKVETIYALSDGCQTIDDIYTKIETIFSDDIEGVVFSSIHKAKGLEAQTVFILRPDLMPHPLAKQAWEVEQENNMKYVAYTRALENLYIVAGE